jgi:hypothetical protein
MGRFWVAIGLWLVLLAACSDGGDGGEGSGNGSAGGGGKSGKPGAQVEPARKLMLSTVIGARLTFGARLEFRGKLLDKSGKAVRDGLVSFALIGESQDCSLAALDVRSDKDGAFQNALIAGEQPAVFRVRVSAEEAADVFVDVAVSGAGFGTLLVGAEYDGPRLVAQRSVYARAGGKCEADGAREEGDRFATLADGQKQVRLPALPAGVSYAVTAVAESPLGVTVAKGCLANVGLTPDAELAIGVPFVDVPLERAGTFELTADLDTSGPASALAVAMSGAADTLVVDSEPGEPAPPDAEARFLLDTLYASLTVDQAPPAWIDLAEALDFDRQNNGPDEPTPDHGLQGRLEIDDKGPLLAIAEIAQPTQDGLTRMRIAAAFSLVAKGKTPAAWQPERISALRASGDADPFEIDLRGADTEPSAVAEFIPARDVLDVTRLRFRAQLGALATEVLHGVLQGEDDGGHLEQIRGVLGCSLVSDWLGDQGYTGACDDDCIDTFCDAVLDRLRVAAEGALHDLDVSRPTLTLEGEFELLDRDGDLVAESMRCGALSGEWPAQRKGARADVVTGTANATAVDDGR